MFDIVLEGHTVLVNAVDVAGGKVISESIDGTGRVWDLESGECKQVIQHNDVVHGL